MFYVWGRIASHNKFWNLLKALFTVLFVNRYFLDTFGVHQKILNNLYRPRLSCGYMIRLLTHPLPPPLPSASCPSFSFFLAFCMTVTGEGWEGMCEKPTLRQRENLALHKSFNTLWCAQNSWVVALARALFFTSISAEYLFNIIEFFCLDGGA